MKYLIIAEKPSVSNDLSKALNDILGSFEKIGKTRETTYYKSDNAAITSAVGHLVELKMPTGDNGKKLPWKFDVLPSIPAKFELQPTERTESRLKHVLSLCKKNEYDIIVNACDAGREGELIFKYIMEIGVIKKPVKRLWMQSMTRKAIQSAWANLKDDAHLVNLTDAAKCRSESDWLVGLNSTRALTCFRSRHGGFNITAVGRVQTPTLAILAKRENLINDFKSIPYYEIEAEFTLESGKYKGKWFNPNFKKDESNPHLRNDRIQELEDANKINTYCKNSIKLKILDSNRIEKKLSPPLFDLQKLQESSPFTASNTLKIAQSLYERHKMITYPRTSSKHLPVSMLAEVKETLRIISNSSFLESRFAKELLENNKVFINKRIFDDKKIYDSHSAIIPTGVIAKLNDQENKIYQLILRRFISVFYEHIQLDHVTRITEVSNDNHINSFITKATRVLHPGYQIIYGKKTGDWMADTSLPKANESEQPIINSVAINEKETLPPPRYDDSSLLRAMKGAGKLLDDDEMRDAMSDNGLGTPATRAAIIEGLLRQKYINRDGRELNVTSKGLRLIELCDEMNLEELTSPSMTGEWELKLNKIANGDYSRKDFMNEIIHFTKDVVNKAKIHLDKTVNMIFPDVEIEAPNCLSENETIILKQTDKTFESKQDDTYFFLPKYIAGRELSIDELKGLMRKGFLDEMEGFVSRFNKPFSAGLKLIKTKDSKSNKIKWKTEFVFEDSEDKNLNERKLIGEIIYNEKKVMLYETEKFYLIPEIKNDDYPDGYLLGKTILSKSLKLEDAKLLFEKGKTGLISNFISKRTKRPFKAHLLLDFKSLKIRWEFPEKKKQN